MLPSRSSWILGAVLRLRFVDGHERRQLLPRHRERGEVQCRHRPGFAHDHGHRFAAEPDVLLGEHGLIGRGGDHAEPVAALDIGRGQHRLDARRRRDVGIDVAEPETRPMVGSADDADRERSVGRLVGAEHVGAVHLGLAVDPLGTVAHRLADRRRRRRGVRGAHMRGHNRGDDLAVAGAAAQHTAEGVHDLLLGGRGRGSQERRRRHQHAGRADAALRGAVREERALQRRGLSTLVEAFEGFHPPTFEAPDRRHARGHRFAVHEHRACSTVARVASHLGGGERQVIAEHVAEAPCRSVHLGGRSVHREGDRAHRPSPQLASARLTKIDADRRR